MAGGSVNHWHGIGRLTRDPERRDFQGGSAVVTFGFAFTGQSRKNQQTGKWEDEPCFIDVKCFISNEGKGPGKTIMDYTKKGSQLYVEGRLVLEQWEDKNGGGKRSKHVIHLDEFMFCGAKQDNGNDGTTGGGNQNQQRSNGGNHQGGQRSGGNQRGGTTGDGTPAGGWNAQNYEYGGGPGPQADEDIPF